MRNGSWFLIGAILLASHEAFAQTVQLPSYHFFGTNSSVLVPDRGVANLGGVRRGAEGYSGYGAPGLRGNRAYGSAASGGGISVHAHIHDFEAMDRALLEQAAANRRPAAFDFSRRAVDGPITDIPTAVDADVNVPTAMTAKALMARADQAFLNGNRGAARVYYQMAARHGSGDLRERAQAKYDALAKISSRRTATKAATHD